MNRGQKAALLVDMANELLQRGSWCGETHIQKATFLLEELFEIGMGFEFVLYKHGPFSFELRDELTAMASDGFLEFVVRHPGYGPSLVTAQESKTFIERFPNTLARHHHQIGFVANCVRDMGVAELERLATALFIRTRCKEVTAHERAAELVRIKPHIQLADARAAFKEAEQILSDAHGLAARA